MNDVKDMPAPAKKKPDRILGDEWENWTGELDESLTYRETATLFAIFAGVALAVVLVGLAFAFYMIEPRLFILHPMLVGVVGVVTGLVIAASGVFALLLILSVFTGKNLVFYGRMGQVAAARILPLTISIARRLGISRDRLGNSFVNFSNAIVRASYRPGKGRPVIILPRCLTPALKKEVTELGGQAGIGVFTATGGGQARKIIREERPSAVIGVACERDLLSGIADVAPKLPTIGVTNQRPEGPCKNTLVDMGELKRAIETLTGVHLD